MCIRDRASRNAAHARIGEYFSNREYGSRRRDEEPWQWQEANEKEKLVGTLGDLEMLALFIQSERTHELVTHWVGANTDRAAATYAASYQKLGAECSESHRQKHLQNIG